MTTYAVIADKVRSTDSAARTSPQVLTLQQKPARCGLVVLCIVACCHLLVLEVRLLGLVVVTTQPASTLVWASHTGYSGQDNICVHNIYT